MLVAVFASVHLCFCLPETFDDLWSRASGVSVDMPLRIIRCDTGLT
jgi:hypothetical protein